jgi:hypothetical protein
MAALWLRRKRQEEHAALVARGELVWTTTFTPQARNKLRFAFVDSLSGVAPYAAPSVAQLARTQILRDEGLVTLTGASDNAALNDVLKFYESCPDILVPSLIEAVGRGIAVLAEQDPSIQLDFYVEKVQETLYEHAIGYDYVFPNIIERSAQELHEEIVVPVLHLLAGRKGFEQVEVAYQKALREIGEDPADAITDAATALQEALTAVGAKGNTLGALLKSARSSNLLAPYDEKLVTGIVEWTEADRSTKGDAHNARPASRDDAWLAVHVTGALIRRLAEGCRSS